MKLFLAFTVIAGLAGAQPPAQAVDSRIPVIVELFTSEGCSSCPSADRLLDRLDRSQPLSGVHVIALEEHVDYWNNLGWKDPFSSAQYRVRQNDYAARVFQTDNIYTPQMIVNGQAGFSGGDASRAQQEIGRAAQSPISVVDLKTAPNATDANLIDLTVDVTNPKTAKIRNSNVYLAVTESGLATNVSAGENSGRRLLHAPVVRSFGVIGKLDARGTNTGHITNTLRLPVEWQRANLRAVVFVQERDSYKITGAATIDLPSR
jgi:hypothetical protein